VFDRIAHNATLSPRKRDAEHAANIMRCVQAADYREATGASNGKAASGAGTSATINTTEE
jgi:hypothetical protein